MSRFILRRLLVVIPTIFLVTAFVFSLILLIPGDPAAQLLGDEGTSQHLERFRHELGFDRPIHVQYVHWLSDVLRGDLRYSIRNGERITTELKNRYQITLQLGLGSFLLSLLIALPVGIYSAVRPYSVGDNVGTVFAIAGVSLPSFWFGIMLIYLFAVILGWLPSYGYVEPWVDPWGNIQRMILPVLVGGTNGAAGIMRQTRSAMMEVLREDYIRTAHAKGLAESRVLLRHALKNGFMPVLTVMGVQIVGILEGFTVVETIFGLPGMGQYAVGAAKALDLPAIQGALLAFGGVVLVANLAVDVLYGFLDPRVRYT